MPHFAAAALADLGKWEKRNKLGDKKDEIVNRSGT